MASTTQFNELVEEFIKVNNQLTQIQKRPVQITPDLRLSTSMIHLLDTIGNYPESTITQLAERLGVTKGAISQQIPTLKKMALIEVSQKAANKKNKLISLTEQGKQVYHSHNSLHQELYTSIQAALTSFSEEQVDTILVMLNKVATSINDYQERLTQED